MTKDQAAVAAVDELLRPCEVADLFRVDPGTVRRWSRDGKLTRIRTAGGDYRYHAGPVRALLRGETGATTMVAPAFLEALASYYPHADDDGVAIFCLPCGGKDVTGPHPFGLWNADLRELVELIAAHEADAHRGRPA